MQISRGLRSLCAKFSAVMSFVGTSQVTGGDLSVRARLTNTG